ncbi:MAG: hypothetical protein ACLR17_11525 [Enterobacteriaceae bacterium]
MRVQELSTTAASPSPRQWLPLSRLSLTSLPGCRRRKRSRAGGHYEPVAVINEPEVPVVETTHQAAPVDEQPQLIAEVDEAV